MSELITLRTTCTPSNGFYTQHTHMEDSIGSLPTASGLEAVPRTLLTFIFG